MQLKNGKRQVTFYCDKSIIDRFQSLYPSCLTLFLSRVLEAVLTDRQLFNKIFFKEF